MFFVSLLMVSLQELITQRKTEVSSIEAQLQRQQESISEGERRLGQQERIFLEETTPLPLTLGRQASLARAVGIGEVARAARITRREKQKARRQARPKFQEARVEIEEARAEVKAASTSLDPVRRQIRDAENFLIGRKLALAGRSKARLRGRQQKRGFSAGVAELEVFERRATRRETLKITELPPKPLGPVGSTGEIKTFGQPEKFARSFRKATGQTSFTIAVPIRKQAGKIFVQDFNFRFEDGKLVRSRKTGSALITEEQFLTADLRRRRRNPEFTFGSTARFQTERKITPREEFLDITTTQAFPDITATAAFRERFFGERDPLFTFQVTGPEVSTVGVPFITPGERAAGAIGFIPQVETLQQIVDIPTPVIQTSPRLPVISRLLGRTQEDIIATQRNILEAERLQRGLGLVQQQLIEDPSQFIGQPGVEQVGRDITLTEEFFRGRFEPIPGTVTEAREFFEGLPRGRRRRAVLASRLTGVGGAVVGLGEFFGTLGLSLGQQTFTDEELQELEDASTLERILGRQVRFGRGLGTFRQQLGLPTTTTFGEDPFQFVTEQLRSPALQTELALVGVLAAAGGGGIVSRFRRVGGREAALETFGALSPLRIRPGVFTAPIIAESPVEAIGLRIQRDGVTRRIIAGLGREDPFAIISTQQIRRGVGIGETIIETPATLIRPSGLIEEGIVQVGTESLFRVFPGQVVRLQTPRGLFDLPGFRGGISEALTQQRFTIFEGERTLALDFTTPSTRFLRGRGAGVEVDVGEFTTRFAAGRRRPIFETDIFRAGLDFETGRLTPTGFIRRPTGRFRVEPSITGREFDLGAILAREGDIIRVGGRPRRPTRRPRAETILDQQQLSTQLQSIRTSLGEFRAPQISTGLEGLPVIVGGPGLSAAELQRQARAGLIQQDFVEVGGLIPPAVRDGLTQRGFQITEEAVIPILASALETGLISRERQEAISLLSPAIISRERLDARERLQQAQAQAQRQELRSVLTRQAPTEVISRRTRPRIDFAFPIGLGAVGLPLLPRLAPRVVDAFNTFVKSKGRFSKVNKKPQRLENALSLGAELVDNSTSRQFKVRKSGTIRRPKGINTFFQDNRFKFREFKQTAKQRKRTPFNFIERINFAIDTPNEVAGIPLKGILEQRRRRAAGIKRTRRRRRSSINNLSFTDI